MLAHEVEADDLGEDKEGHSVAKIPLEVQKCKMLIMTSHENHNDTISHFRQNDYFGGDESSFFFFPQTMLPALSEDGKILMKSEKSMAMSPNGNGAFFDTLCKEQRLRLLLD